MKAFKKTLASRRLWRQAVLVDNQSMRTTLPGHAVDQNPVLTLPSSQQTFVDACCGRGCQLHAGCGIVTMPCSTAAHCATLAS